MIKKLAIGVAINSLVFFVVAYGLSALLRDKGDLLGSALFAGIFGCFEFLFMLSYMKKKEVPEEEEDEEE